MCTRRASHWRAHCRATQDSHSPSLRCLATWTLRSLLCSALDLITAGCNHRDVTIILLQNYFATMGQNRPLRFLSANGRHVQVTHNHASYTPLTTISLSPADGPLRSEPLPGYSPQSVPVLVRCALHSRETRRNAKQSRRSPPEELPVRLAHRVRELDDLPQGLSDMPSIRRVKEWYAQSFEASIVTGRHCR
jgi:hypothetical protein